jgi:hypothetical protein
LTTGKVSRPSLQDTLLAALNEQGDLFQDRCVEELRRHAKRTGWNVEAVNHPVTKGAGTTVQAAMRMLIVALAPLARVTVKSIRSPVLPLSMWNPNISVPVASAA